jgi:large subunit ribosomal protein L6
MTLSIPSFLTITRDESGQKATLSVLDTDVPHQRAMWGMLFS